MSADAHLMLAFEGHRPPSWVGELLAGGEVPGLSLFRFANVDTPAQVADLTAALEAASPSDLPLLVAADQETGQLMGLGDTTPFPGAMALGATGDADLARRVAMAVGTETRAMGVTVAYAPVCDVATQPDNPSLGIRAFSDDAATVAEMAVATVAGLAEAGVAAVAKHFPGKGEARVDPHHELPVLDLDRRRLEEVEFVPFRAAIGAGVPMLMSGHYALPRVTGRPDLPTTLSAAVITEVVRGDLGFDGVVITDALDMKALPQGVGQIVDVIAALRAGVDLLLSTPDAEAQARLRSGLALAVSRDLVDACDLARSRARIGRLRRWLAGFPRPSLAAVRNTNHLALAKEASERSITLVREGDVLPLARGGTLLAVMPRPIDLTPADTSSAVAPGLADALRSHHPRVIEVVTGHPPSANDVAAVAGAARSADAVVLGTISAGPEQVDLVSAVLSSGKPTVTVALRTPFDLALYPAADTHLCTYSILPPSLQALADVLFGVLPARGSLPAAIPGLYPRGHGLP